MTAAVEAGDPARTRRAPARRRGLGVALVLGAALLWSTGGLFVRALDTDVWTMLFWRSLFGGLSLAAVVIYEEGGAPMRAFRGLGWMGLCAIPLSTVSMICYVSSLAVTTVANVLVIYATLPFAAAGVAFLWGGERPKPRLLAASVVALAGIAFTAGFAASGRDLGGLALSFGTTASFAVVLVMAGRRRAFSLAAINAAACFLCALVCAPLVPPVLPGPGAILLLAGFGITSTALAHMMFLNGGRHIPASEAGLISLLDVAAGPLWVWLAFGENPGRAAVAGGALILAAQVWYLLGDRGGARPPPA